MNAYQFAVHLLNAPDGTFDCDTGARITCTAGYEVGGYAAPVVATPHAISHPYTSGLEPRLRALVMDARRLRKRLGRWTDPADGRVYYDVTSIFADRGTALRQGRRNREKAIWDWANMTAINVED